VAVVVEVVEVSGVVVAESIEEVAVLVLFADRVVAAQRGGRWAAVWRGGRPAELLCADRWAVAPP
jgi:hypothetical protein